MAVTLSRVSAPLLNRYATPQAARTKFRAKVRTRIWKSFFIGREPSNVHHPAHAHLHADLVEGGGFAAGDDGLPGFLLALLELLQHLAVAGRLGEGLAQLVQP